jgi:hypothetical protein
MSSQYVAADSQKFTCPVVTFAEPLVTAAVSATTLPDAIEVTVFPDEVTVRAVEVVEVVLTVNASGAVATSDPETPLIDSIAVPAVAVLLAASVNVLLLVAGFGENDAVTPAGRPVTEKLTLPLNPN